MSGLAVSLLLVAPLSCQPGPAALLAAPLATCTSFLSLPHPIGPALLLPRAALLAAVARVMADTVQLAWGPEVRAATTALLGPGSGPATSLLAGAVVLVSSVVAVTGWDLSRPRPPRTLPRLLTCAGLAILCLLCTFSIYTNISYRPGTQEVQERNVSSLSCTAMTTQQALLEDALASLSVFWLGDMGSLPWQGLGLAGCLACMAGLGGRGGPLLTALPPHPPPALTPALLLFGAATTSLHCLLLLSLSLQLQRAAARQVPRLARPLPAMLGAGLPVSLAAALLPAPALARMAGAGLAAGAGTAVLSSLYMICCSVHPAALLSALVRRLRGEAGDRTLLLGESRDFPLLRVLLLILLLGCLALLPALLPTHTTLLPLALLPAILLVLLLSRQLPGRSACFVATQSAALASLACLARPALPELAVALTWNGLVAVLGRMLDRTSHAPHLNTISASVK